MAKMRPGALVEGLSGTLGNAVVVRFGDGRVQVRQKVTPRNPRTPLQEAARERLTRAARLFRTLNPEEALSWHAYARREAEQLTANGQPADPRAQSAFVRLATKILQVDPEATPPRTPPAASFLGDALVVTAAPLPLAPLGERGQGGEGVRFTASAPNAPGVVTELLLQPLRTSLSRPDPGKYRTQTFATFTQGVLSRDVTAPQGWHAPAYRFVFPATGQASSLVPLPPVWVG
ncbi:MAG: hypothetical protein KIT11_02710 [Fimbriimonadaceae bacterium]|nr:hypothetical protein [Fimbriimonadaceae bacterium]QYK54722.1 MAG: hypothetical protein KF733_06825 [Fimbriimonadaceae bacterium]